MGPQKTAHEILEALKDYKKILIIEEDTIKIYGQTQENLNLCFLIKNKGQIRSAYIVDKIP